MSFEQTLREAQSTAYVWDPGAEDRHRRLLTAARESNEAARLAQAWNQIGVYLIDRLAPEAAALAFEVALEHAQGDADAAPREGLNAARALIDGPPSTTDDDRRTRYQAFETAFLSGQLRYDTASSLITPLESPAAHVHDTGYARSIRRNLLTASAIFGKILASASVAIVVAVVLWRSEWAGRHPMVIRAVVAFGVIAALVWARVAWKAFASLREHWVYWRLHRVTTKVTEERSTHAQALAVLRRFIESREPFALYLRAFEAEGFETMTPGIFSLDRTRPVAGPRNHITSYHAGASALDRYLAARLAACLPVITVSSPKALAPTIGRGDSAVPRLDVPDTLWRRTVRCLASAAHLIVVEAGAAGPGLRAELGLLSELGRYPDTLIVIPSQDERRETVDRRAFVQGIDGENPVFLSPVDPILEPFGRIVDINGLADRDPTELLVFEGLLPERTSTVAMPSQRFERRHALSEGIEAIRRGRAAADGGAPADAAAAYSEAAQIFAGGKCVPERALALYHRGVIEAGLRHYTEAEHSLREAARIQREVGPPDKFISTTLRLVDLLTRLGRSVEAEAHRQELRLAMERWNLALADDRDGGSHM